MALPFRTGPRVARRRIRERIAQGSEPPSIEVEPLYAHPPTPSTEAVRRQARETISCMDPLVILAGIKQFGLAPDGSDLRDLETAIRALSNPAGWR